MRLVKYVSFVLVLAMCATGTAVAGCYCDPNYDIGCFCDGFGNCEIVASPLVINLSHGEWQLTGLTNPVQFDIRAIGRKETVGWTAADSNIAFLVLDRNHNGVVDDGSE